MTANDLKLYQSTASRSHFSGGEGTDGNLGAGRDYAPLHRRRRDGLADAQGTQSGATLV
jgi:hypothetical protein